MHVFVVGILNMFLKILKSWKSYLPSKTAILRCLIFNMCIYEHSKHTNVMYNYIHKFAYHWDIAFKYIL